MALKERQKRFVEEYLVDLNASAAYQRAGYKVSGHRAEVNASRLLKNADVRTYLDELRRPLAEHTQLSAERVLREYALLGLSDIGQILDFSDTAVKMRPANEIPENARRAISSMKVKRYVEGNGDKTKTVEVVEFKLWPKESALEKLARYVKLEPIPPPPGDGNQSTYEQLFQRVCMLAEFFRSAAAGRTLPSGPLLVNGRTEPLDSPPTPPEANGISH